MFYRGPNPGGTFVATLTTSSLRVFSENSSRPDSLMQETRTGLSFLFPAYSLQQDVSHRHKLIAMSCISINTLGVRGIAWDEVCRPLRCIEEVNELLLCFLWGIADAVKEALSLCFFLLSARHSTCILKGPRVHFTSLSPPPIWQRQIVRA